MIRTRSLNDTDIFDGMKVKGHKDTEGRDEPGQGDYVTVLQVAPPSGETWHQPRTKNGSEPYVTVLQVDKEYPKEKVEQDEPMTIYRLPGERLGMALKFEGGAKAAENVQRVFIQSIHPGSPAARAQGSITGQPLNEGDEILAIGDRGVVKTMTRGECVSLLRDAPVRIELVVRRCPDRKKGPPPPVPPRKSLPQQTVPPLLTPNEEITKPVSFVLPELEGFNGVREKIQRLEAARKSRPPDPPPLPPRVSTSKDVFPSFSSSTTVLQPELPDKFAGASLSLRLPGWEELLQRRAEIPRADLFVDLLAQEDDDERRALESESDDTGSSVSTVIEKFSRGSTANSSFSEQHQSSFDLRQVLSPFEQLERELDGVETPPTVQLEVIAPPENFQDRGQASADTGSISPISPPGDSGFMDMEDLEEDMAGEVINRVNEFEGQLQLQESRFRKESENVQKSSDTVQHEGGLVHSYVKKEFVEVQQCGMELTAIRMSGVQQTVVQENGIQHKSQTVKEKRSVRLTRERAVFDDDETMGELHRRVQTVESYQCQTTTEKPRIMQDNPTANEQHTADPLVPSLGTAKISDEDNLYENLSFSHKPPSTEVPPVVPQKRETPKPPPIPPRITKPSTPTDLPNGHLHHDDNTLNTETTSPEREPTVIVHKSKDENMYVNKPPLNPINPTSRVAKTAVVRSLSLEEGRRSSDSPRVRRPRSFSQGDDTGPGSVRKSRSVGSYDGSRIPRPTFLFNSSRNGESQNSPRPSTAERLANGKKNTSLHRYGFESSGRNETTRRSPRATKNKNKEKKGALLNHSGASSDNEKTEVQPKSPKGQTRQVKHVRSKSFEEPRSRNRPFESQAKTTAQENAKAPLTHSKSLGHDPERSVASNKATKSTTVQPDHAKNENNSVSETCVETTTALTAAQHATTKVVENADEKTGELCPCDANSETPDKAQIKENSSGPSSGEQPGQKEEYALEERFLSGNEGNAECSSEAASDCQEPQVTEKDNSVGDEIASEESSCPPIESSNGSELPKEFGAESLSDLVLPSGFEPRGSLEEEDILGGFFTSGAEVDEVTQFRVEVATGGSGGHVITSGFPCAEPFTDDKTFSWSLSRWPLQDVPEEDEPEEEEVPLQQLCEDDDEDVFFDEEPPVEINEEKHASEEVNCEQSGETNAAQCSADEVVCEEPSKSNDPVNQDKTTADNTNVQLTDTIQAICEDDASAGSDCLDSSNSKKKELDHQVSSHQEDQQKQAHQVLSHEDPQQNHQLLPHQDQLQKQDEKFENIEKDLNETNSNTSDTTSKPTPDETAKFLSPNDTISTHIVEERTVVESKVNGQDSMNKSASSRKSTLSALSRPVILSEEPEMEEDINLQVEKNEQEVAHEVVQEVESKNSKQEDLDNTAEPEIAKVVENEKNSAHEISEPDLSTSEPEKERVNVADSSTNSGEDQETGVPGEQYFGHEIPLRQGQQRRLPVVVDHVTKAEAAMHQGALYRPPPEGHEFPPEYSEEARPVPLTSLKTDPYFCEATKTFRSASLTAVNSVSVKDRIALFSQCGSSPSVTNGGSAVPACSTLPRTPCNSVQSTIPSKPIVTTAISESKPPSPLSRWHSAASLLTASDRRPSYVSTYPETQLLRRPGYERSSSSSTLLTSYLQERRSSTSSKLKGLVIPQGPSKQTMATSVLPLIGPSASWRPAPLIPTSFQLSHSKPVTPPVPERPVLVSPVRSSVAPATPPPLPPTSPPPLPPVSTVPLQSKPNLPVTLLNGLDSPSPAANSTKPFRNPIERLDSLLGTSILTQQNVKTPDLSTPDSGPSSISETLSGNVQQVSPSKPSLSPPPITAQRTQSAPNTIENSSSSRSRFWSLRDDSDDDSNSVISLRTEDSRQTADDSLSDADSLHQERSEFRPRRLSQQRTVLATTTNTIVSKQQPTTDSVSQFRALAEKWESRSLTNGPAVVAPSLVTSSTTSITATTYQTGTNPRSPRNGTESNKLPPSLQPRSVIQDSKSVLPLLERSLSSLDLVGSRLQKTSRSVSVSDIRKSFETKKQVAEHKRFSSMDSTASDSGVGTPGGLYGSASSLHAGNNSVGVDGFGSTTSLASDECCPQTPPTPATSSLVLQGLLDEAAALLEAESAGLGAQCQLDAVVLHKDSPQGPVGVTLAGGADYEIKEITIHKVIVGGLADRDGRLRKGDRILSINGLSLQGQTHRQALDLLKAHRQEVILIVCKETSPCKILDTRSGHLSNGQPLDKSKNSSPNSNEDKSSALVSSTTSLSKGKANPSLPAGVVQLHLLKDGAGLGFSLDGGQGSPLGDKPLTVKRVFKGGAADREGHLGVGDQVLYVGSQSVTSMTRTEAWNYMKKLPDGPVTLTVRPLLEEAPPN